MATRTVTQTQAEPVTPTPTPEAEGPSTSTPLPPLLTPQDIMRDWDDPLHPTYDRPEGMTTEQYQQQRRDEERSYHN